VGIGYHTIL